MKLSERRMLRIKVLNRRKKRLIRHIFRIEVKLHKIELTGSYTWWPLCEKLGQLKKLDSNLGWRPGYETYAVRQMKDRKLLIHLNPIRGYMPQCAIQTAYPTKEFLIWLDNILSGLNVSVVEYTIDIFFRKSKRKYIRRHFQTLRRYIYFPYYKNCITYSSTRRLSDKARDINASMELKNKKNWVARKIYERGPDNRKKKGWHIRDLDRIRIEITKYEDELYESGINDLCTFVRDPMFERTFHNTFKFCKFRDKSTVLVNEYDRYETRDERGMKGAFQNEYLSESASVQNLPQYTVQVEELLPLKRLIGNEILNTQKAWIFA